MTTRPSSPESPEKTRQWWIISIGGGYGAFAFYGDEADAEQRRADKACWEGAVGRKRHAEPSDAVLIQAEEQS